MIALIPVFLLIAASIFLQIMGRMKFSSGQTWLISSITALIAWIAMIPIRLIIPSTWQINDWLSGVTTNENIIFQYTKETWVLGFLLVSLLVAVIFHEAKYLESGSHVNIITGSMALTAFGLLSIQAGNGITFLMAWVLIDIVEFLILAGIIKDGAKHRTAIISLITRVLGIILLLLYLILQTPGSAFAGEKSSAVASIILVFMAVLRMGIFPMHIPYSEEPKIRRGVSSILRFIPILSVFSFLFLIGPQVFTKIQYNGLMALFTIGTIFGSISWFFAKNELDGRPYWIFTFGCLAMVTFLRSSTAAMVGVAAMMVSGGTALFLFLTSQRKKILILILLLLGMLTVPFTPTAAIPQGLWGSRLEFSNIFLLPGLALLLGGEIRHSLHREKRIERRQDWVWFFQTAGLIITAITPWIAEAFSLEEVKKINYWGYSAALVIIIGATIMIDFLRRRKGSSLIVWNAKFVKNIEPVVYYFDKFFQFNWVVAISEAVGKFIAFVINLFVRILEGDGGILWSFLFLVLLASLLITAQVLK